VLSYAYLKTPTGPAPPWSLHQIAPQTKNHAEFACFLGNRRIQYEQRDHEICENSPELSSIPAWKNRDFASPENIR